MKYIIDTNICIHMIQNNRTVLNSFEEKKGEGVGISAITFAELEYGVSNSSSKKAMEQNRNKLISFLPLVTILPFDTAAAISYGEIHASLRQKGALIGIMDMLIAAHALAQNAILVTNNISEFGRIKKLKLEDWVQ